MTFNCFRDDYSRTYDVRANAGDFIIGEVGRIDINSGQTLEVILLINSKGRQELPCLFGHSIFGENKFFKIYFDIKGFYHRVMC